MIPVHVPFTPGFPEEPYFAMFTEYVKFNVLLSTEKISAYIPVAMYPLFFSFFGIRVSIAGGVM